MRYCFSNAGLIVMALLVPVAATAVEPPRVTSVVRADKRTGRLIRSVVLAPGFLPPAKQAGRPLTALPAPLPLGHIVHETARKYEIDPLLVHSVIEVESNYNPFAVSPKGARGLMQLIPATAKRFGVQNSFDPQQNIEGGVRYLKYLTSLFPNDLRLVLAAYNAGEGAVARYKDVPRYRETEQYVYRVGKRYGKKRATAKPLPSSTMKPAAPQHRPVEQFLDSEGRLCLRTL